MIHPTKIRANLKESFVEQYFENMKYFPGRKV